jgi:hypothetical protein
VRQAILTAILISSFGAIAMATDVINKDNKVYKLTVQSEGKLSISNYTLKANTTMSGLCNASFCSFEIPGSKIEAKKEDRVTVHNGKFVKQ